MVNTFLPMLVIAGVLYLLGGWFNVLWTLSAWLAATLVFFILLPWLPVRDFSAKGLILGAMVAVPFVILYQFMQTQNPAGYNLMRVLPSGIDHDCPGFLCHPQYDGFHPHYQLDERPAGNF